MLDAPLWLLAAVVTVDALVIVGTTLWLAPRRTRRLVREDAPEVARVALDEGLGTLRADLSSALENLQVNLQTYQQALFYGDGTEAAPGVLGELAAARDEFSELHVQAKRTWGAQMGTQSGEAREEKAARQAAAESALMATLGPGIADWLRDNAPEVYESAVKYPAFADKILAPWIEKARDKGAGLVQGKLVTTTRNGGGVC